MHCHPGATDGTAIYLRNDDDEIADDPATGRPIQVTVTDPFANDVDIVYKFHRRFSLFASAANLTRVVDETYRQNPEVPDYARRILYTDYGVQFIVGLKGEY